MEWLKRVRERRQERKKPTDDPIEHVVVLMFENRSFDQMLGCFRSLYPELEGVDPNALLSNCDLTGEKCYQYECDDSAVDPDPKHEVSNVAVQLFDGNAGFLRDYLTSYAGIPTDQHRKIMGYFALDSLPALHTLAKNFTICDRWYSSVPGPTWTNRFFVHSGTSLGRVHMPEGILTDPRLYFGYDQDTIYDRLRDHHIPWKIYYGDVPQSLVLVHQRRIRNARHYEPFGQFLIDASRAEDDFPAYSFIEPRYFHIPYGEPQNDDHPPHSTIQAQQLLAEVYNALRANERLWNKTLLVVLYDEHGGFYDHISPPQAVAPDDRSDEHDFKRYGVRVPALLVSPWVAARVSSTVFDHTSILKYLIEKWDLSPLTRRERAANDLAVAIPVLGQPRTDTPARIDMPAAMMGVLPESSEFLNENQKALLAFADFLESQIETPRPAAMAADALPKAHRARLKVDGFLDQQKARSDGEDMG